VPHETADRFQVHTPSGRRRVRPGKLDADKGYDSAANRAWLRRRGIRSRIARRGIESSTRLGRHRWRVERVPSWLSCWRRLQVRWDRDSERWFALCCWRARSPASSVPDLAPGEDHATPPNRANVA
jgi:IS5 family transposase